MHRLSTDPRFKAVRVFKVDYDSSAEMLRQWRVSHRSTLVAFRGRTEKARSTGQVDVDALRAVFDASLL